MSDYMDFAEAHAQKQLDQDEQREAAIRADERRRVLDELGEWYFEFRGVPTVEQFAGKVREMKRVHRERD